MHPMKVTQAA